MAFLREVCVKGMKSVVNIVGYYPICPYFTQCFYFMTQKILLRKIFVKLRNVVSIYDSSIKCSGNTNNYSMHTAKKNDIYRCNISVILSLFSFQLEWLDTYEGNIFLIKSLSDLKQMIKTHLLEYQQTDCVYRLQPGRKYVLFNNFKQSITRPTKYHCLSHFIVFWHWSVYPCPCGLFSTVIRLP